MVWREGGWEREGEGVGGEGEGGGREGEREKERDPSIYDKLFQTHSLCCDLL